MSDHSKNTDCTVSNLLRNTVNHPTNNTLRATLHHVAASARMTRVLTDIDSSGLAVMALRASVDMLNRVIADGATLDERFDGETAFILEAVRLEMNFISFSHDDWKTLLSCVKDVEDLYESEREAAVEANLGLADDLLPFQIRDPRFRAPTSRYDQ